MTEKFLKDKVELHCGDCLQVLPTLPENSIDAAVCDPPYHLTSIVKRFSKSTPENESFANNNNHTGYNRRLSGGFMGKQWDGGDVAFRVETWREVYRVLKPGAHLVAFGGTRTFHRMACAIEDAGFEIRDTIMWLYGSGFPKSHDVSKGIDRAAGMQRDSAYKPNNGNAVFGKGMGGGEWNAPSDPPATDAAKQWQGWGTALKPCLEPIVLARKPLSESTVAANVLKHGVGALNINGCRVHANRNNDSASGGERQIANCTCGIAKEGRWPGNLIHDGSDEVVGLFLENESTPRTPFPNHHTGLVTTFQRGSETSPYDDAGSAARFFYTSKAGSDDRLGSAHPTVKPLDLMQYLIRLVTPHKGTVLDLFAGTGTTGEAAWREGMGAVLIEREAEYQVDIRRRMALAMAGPDERMWQSIKAKQKDKVMDAGPLFGGTE